ncbi:MAG: endonuclease/exonuclease/phosphatase family protein [Vulcanimicrobiota bacterium]
MNIRVASYNVKNLFMDRDIDSGSHTRPKSERSLAALAESLERMEADVVSFQELSSQETLEKDLLSRRGLAEKYPHVAWTKGNDERGIRVGIISKYPFTLVENHADHEFPFVDGSGTGQFSRDLLRVDINTDNDPEAELTVYNSHFKSRRPADPGEVDSDVRRLSEGTATRNIVEQEMAEFPNRMFVVTGDFNDNTDDAPVQVILNGTSPGAEKWVDSLDHLAAGDRNTWPANPNHTRFPPEQFDHIIYPQRFDDQVTRHAPLRFEQSIDSDTRWVSSAASDHLPIIADIEIKD